MQTGLFSPGRETLPNVGMSRSTVLIKHKITVLLGYSLKPPCQMSYLWVGSVTEFYVYARLWFQVWNWLMLRRPTYANKGSTILIILDQAFCARSSVSSLTGMTSTRLQLVVSSHTCLGVMGGGSMDSWLICSSQCAQAECKYRLVLNVMLFSCNKINTSVVSAGIIITLLTVLFSSCMRWFLFLVMHEVIPLYPFVFLILLSGHLLLDLCASLFRREWVLLEVELHVLLICLSAWC